MAPLRYFAVSTDSGCILVCEHEHISVTCAVACISAAGGYVIAVEDRQLRELNDEEELEFRYAMYGAPTSLKHRLFVRFKALKPVLN